MTSLDVEKKGISVSFCANTWWVRCCEGVVLSAMVLCFASAADAQGCAEELHALQDLHSQMRAEVLADHAPAAVAIWSRHKLETPQGYGYEGNVACQKWFREVGNDHRFGCFFESARDQFTEAQKRQSPGAGDPEIQAALEQVSHRASVKFSCSQEGELYLICQPTAEKFPDAWCARRVDHDTTLEFPSDASCKVVDSEGVELVSVVEGTDLSCPEHVATEADNERSRVRAERRATVAAAGTFIALMSALAVPATFVPEGVARLLRRVHVLHQSEVSRIHHNSFRARERVLPLLGMSALSVSSLSSRFWWAGVLTASCGITSDILLAQYWQHGGRAIRGVGIATATVGSLAGLALDIETLAYSDVGSARAFVPTLRLGVAQLELGLLRRF